MLDKIQSLLEDFQLKVAKISSLPDLFKLKADFLGKKGILTPMLESIALMPVEERKALGAKINELKAVMLEEIDKRKEELDIEILTQKSKTEARDLSLPGRGYNGCRGRIHPISKVIYDIECILSSMGFIRADGPEIETSWYNFDALNIPPHHPARQMHDTFYINKKDELLRTHTSNVQIRYLKEHKPPCRIYSIGKVYRSDHDATHTPMFHQLELMALGGDISIANLKWCLQTFLALFFEIEGDEESLDSIMRFRPSFFPFTEPSYEVDIRCDRSSKDSIIIGKGNDWIEVLGCGMVHNKVLHNVEIDPTQDRGFACGLGIERLAMLKYNIPDLRYFFSGDLFWLSNFGFSSFSE